MQIYKNGTSFIADSRNKQLTFYSMKLIRLSTHSDGRKILYSDDRKITLEGLYEVVQKYGLLP